MENDKRIRSVKVSGNLLWLNVVVTIIYFAWWLNPFHVGNPILYSLLFFGEIYHITMSLLFWLTIWPENYNKSFSITPNRKIFFPSLDIFVPVAGEPIEIIRNTVQNVLRMRCINSKIYILNDGLVAGKDNWKEVEKLANELDVNCITRTTPGGAKAGNINYALKQTRGDIVVIFDSDMAPHEDFLEKVIPYFQDEKVGVVQTPQYYKNQNISEIAKGAWEQQEFFFGPIMEGKERSNSAFICGTNVAIRRQALEEVGGMYEESIAEDFLTGMFIHANGWKSHYINEVLAEGLAPEDLLSYNKQQFRWARGSMEMLISKNPLFKKGLSLTQRLEYLASTLYHFNGLVVAIDIFTPLAFLFFGIEPVAATTTSFALFFIPFIFLNLYTINRSSGGSITFRAISFSQSNWILQVKAFIDLLLNKKSSFAVTPKQAQSGNFLPLIYPHIIYSVLGIIAAFAGVYREGLNPSVATNISWVIFNIVLFVPYMQTAFNWNNLPFVKTKTVKNWAR